MRPGEILGLQVRDAEGSMLWVRRVYRGGIDEPKVRRSHREIALSNGTASLLTEWMDSLVDHNPFRNRINPGLEVTCLDCFSQS